MKTCILTLAAAALASLASAQGSIDNSAAMKSLQSRAATLPDGDYTITASDGTPMIYTRVGGQSYAPGSGDASSISLQDLGDNSMRISMGNNKCISAQWGGKFNWAGVLYVCAIGKGPVVRGLAPDKQHWLFIPAGGASAPAPAATSVATVVRVQANAKPAPGLTANAPAANDKTQKVPKKSAPAPVVKDNKGRVLTCKKTATWIKRHPGYVKSAKSNHPECAHLLSKRDHLVKRDLELEERDNELVKRAGGRFYIIAVDHLDDMTSRALTKGSVGTGDGGNVASWKLDEFQEGNSAQIFTINSA